MNWILLSFSSAVEVEKPREVLEQGHTFLNNLLFYRLSCVWYSINFALGGFVLTCFWSLILTLLSHSFAILSGLINKRSAAVHSKNKEKHLKTVLEDRWVGRKKMGMLSKYLQKKTKNRKRKIPWKTTSGFCLKTKLIFYYFYFYYF